MNHILKHTLHNCNRNPPSSWVFPITLPYATTSRRRSAEVVWVNPQAKKVKLLHRGIELVVEPVRGSLPGQEEGCDRKVSILMHWWTNQKMILRPWRWVMSLYIISYHINHKPINDNTHRRIRTPSRTLFVECILQYRHIYTHTNTHLNTNLPSTPRTTTVTTIVKCVSLYMISEYLPTDPQNQPSLRLIFMMRFYVTPV